jgi:phosphoribosylformylglycinamidine synthase
MAFGNKIGVDLVSSGTIDWFANLYGAIVFSTIQELTDANFIFLGRTNQTSQIQKDGQSIELDVLIADWQATFAQLFPLTVPDAGDIELSTTKASTSIIKPASKRNSTPQTKPRVIIPVFPGTNCEYDSLRAFNAAGATAESLVFNNLSTDKIHQSISALAAHINNAQILMLPGGFSAGDEPDGSAKFIAAILRNQQISDAIHQLLARDGLILGICNGFQALIKSGLLPYGEIIPLDRNSATLSFNLLGRHISRLTATKVVSNSSPWLSSMEIGSIQQVAMSHGEGRLIVNADEAARWFSAGQVACQYVDLNGNPTLDGLFNPNGSDYAIEALTSLDGRILGKMGHSERMGDNLYKNVPGDKVQDIFKNGVRYFK